MNTLLHKKNAESNPLLSYTKAKSCIQPKLTINTLGDIYEQEADAMANMVMRMAANETIQQPKAVTGLIGRSVQRKCADCEKEEKKKTIMRKAENSTTGMPVSASFASSLNANKGGGIPLPQGTRNFMENAFSTDFSNVRIHNGSQATEMNKGINAKAFTFGNDIYFNQGQYNPGSKEGKHLLAHELTHTVQQAGELGRKEVLQLQVRGCNQATTGRDNASDEVEHIISLAQDMVETAIGLLGDDPAPDSTYEEALSTHFGSVTERRRQRLLGKFGRILPMLVPTNFFCNSARSRICSNGNGSQAFWLPADDLIHVCPNFWGMQGNPICQAIIFIHESAHDAGIDSAFWAANNDHPDNRGSQNYPIAGVPGPSTVRRNAREQMPDAYAFFAAHVHNNADTPGDCFSP